MHHASYLRCKYPLGTDGHTAWGETPREQQRMSMFANRAKTSCGLDRATSSLRLSKRGYMVSSAAGPAAAIRITWRRPMAPLFELVRLFDLMLGLDGAHCRSSDFVRPLLPHISSNLMPQRKSRVPIATSPAPPPPDAKYTPAKKRVRIALSDIDTLPGLPAPCAASTKPSPKGPLQ